MSYYISAIISTLLIGIAAHAQSSATEPSPITVEVSQSTYRFAKAMDIGVADDAKAASVGDERDMRLVEDIAHMVAECRRLSAIAGTHFGDPGKSLGGKYANMEFEKDISHATITIEGSKAFVRDEKGRLVLSLALIQNKWLVDIAASFSKVDYDKMPFLETASPAARQTANEISVDYYKTIEEARNAFYENWSWWRAMWQAENPTVQHPFGPTTNPVEAMGARS